MLRDDVTTHLLKLLIDLLLVKYGVNSHSGKTGFVSIGAAALVSTMKVPYFRGDAALCRTFDLLRALPCT